MTERYLTLHISSSHALLSLLRRSGHGEPLTGTRKVRLPFLSPPSSTTSFLETIHSTNPPSHYKVPH